jgi:hypothetical protein
MAVQEKELKGNLPHWPTHEDLKNGSPNRIRLGAPLEGENLIRRYIQVFNDMRDVDWKRWDLGICYIDMEQALADLMACAECAVTEVLPVEIKDSHGRLVLYRANKTHGGCRTFTGRTMFKELHRARTRLLGQPYFRMCNCKGPEWRKARIEELYRSVASARTPKKGDGLYA